MSVKLNETAYEYAQEPIRDGKYVLDERDDWSEHQPSADDENRFIEEHGWGEYAKWHLGLDDEENEETKGKHDDIESAAAHLHGMLDALA